MARFEEIQEIILNARPVEGMAPSNGTAGRERAEQRGTTDLRLSEAKALRKQLEADLDLQGDLIRRHAAGDTLLKVLLDPMDRLIEIRSRRLAEAEASGR